MSSAESPTTEEPPGSPVGDDEDLYRCISPEWWVVDENRVSSAAFKFPVFSVDVASIAGAPELTLSRFRKGSGLAAFSCRAAKDLGCEVRLELDPEYPENKAHAHVYMPQSSGKRKTAAKKLVEACRVLIRPEVAAG